jgi:hypothetical protein
VVLRAHAEEAAEPDHSVAASLAVLANAQNTGPAAAQAATKPAVGR